MLIALQPSQQLRQQASNQVLIDLIDALLLEDTFNLISRGEILKSSAGINIVPAIDLQPGENIFRIWLETEKRCLMFAITASVGAIAQNFSSTSSFSIQCRSRLAYQKP